MADHDLLDTDPETIDRLRRALHAVAATVEEPDRPNVTVLATPLRPRGTGRNHWVAAAAAATVAVVATGALLVATGRSDPQQRASIPTDPPTMESSPNLTALAADCLEQHTTLSDGGAATRVSELPPATSGSIILVEGTDVPGTSAPTRGELFLVGERFVLMCAVDQPDDAPVIRDTSAVLVRLPLSPPPAGAVQVVARTSMTGAAPLSGPGWVEVIGRVAPGVDQLTLSVPDGVSQPAAVADGWFIASVPLGDGVRDNEERLTWTSSGDNQHEARVDQLDVPTPLEICAASSVCVDQRLTNIRQSAVFAELPEQARTLADGSVTVDELVSAQKRFATCLRDTNRRTFATVFGDGGMVIGSGDTSTPALQHAAQEAIRGCEMTHLRYVQEAYGLLDTVRRVEDR